MEQIQNKEKTESVTDCIIREMTCIRCPLGCGLTVRVQNGEISVTGNTCPRGAEYARNEILDPRRTVTSTVRVMGRTDQMLPVKTREDIPKGSIMACMEALRQVEVNPPVHIGDVILRDVAGTGVDIVATGNLDE